MSESRQAHQAWDELAAGHALYALSAADELKFLDHLTDCPRCTTTLDEYRLVGAQLGAVADTEADELPSWQRIRSGIIENQPPRVVDLEQRRRGRAVRMLAAAAAVVTMTAVGVAGWGARHDGGRSTPAIAALTACQQQIGCRAIQLHSSNGSDPVAVLVTGNRVTVAPLSLTAAPAGRTYVLWQMPRDGGPIPVSEFRATDRQTVSTPLPSSYAKTTAFAISLEPSTPTPTRPSNVIAIGSTASPSGSGAA